MASTPQSGGRSPPLKPWERARSSSGPAPFKPPSVGSTSDVVEGSGSAKPWEVSTAERNALANRNALARQLPMRPWQQSIGNGHSGYGSARYGSRLYGSQNSTLFGNTMSGGGYGGSDSGIYGFGINNTGGLGRPLGGYGMGVGGTYGNQLPNNPFGGPPSPQGFWISLLRVMEGTVGFFGRIAFLIEQNAQAFHILISALLQLFDRSGALYGEIARFVLRLLGIRTNPRKLHPPGLDNAIPRSEHTSQKYIDGPAAAASGSWDTVWGK